MHLTPHVGADGFFVFALRPDSDPLTTESRMFCPMIGVPEDPVSGNAHGMLGVYLVHHGLLASNGHPARLIGHQGRFVGRPGRSRCRSKPRASAPRPCRSPATRPSSTRPSSSSEAMPAAGSAAALAGIAALCGTGPLDILLTNDDGATAAGIRALRAPLVAAGHRVTLAAPDRNASGSAMSFTWGPVLVTRDPDDAAVFAIGASPATRSCWPRRRYTRTAGGPTSSSRASTTDRTAVRC